MMITSAAAIIHRTGNDMIKSWSRISSMNSPSSGRSIGYYFLSITTVLHLNDSVQIGQVSQIIFQPSININLSGISSIVHLTLADSINSSLDPFVGGSMLFSNLLLNELFEPRIFGDPLMLDV
ncbi:hypothetical protein WICPIJ_004005 [Wickerhamomyces pijperi]|uniref:Uncharacterized protein n=1 Tax=Wickerhamomyces pijperi TaxID=599730 RepID=A0A9P8TNB6_WICPI|nr:hypothetical protein WICPIJ_004005 [Wickerhamomyces pijperi]